MTKFQKVLLIGGGLFDLGEGMLGPLFALFAQKIGGDILQISWASALYLFVVGFLTVVFGKISDTWNKEKMMILGYSLGTVFTFAYLLVSKPIHLFFVEAGLGVATALALPTWNALYSEHGNIKKHGLSWGIASGMSRMISAISIVLGGYVASMVSFNFLFIAMGSLQAIATIYQAKIFYMKESKEIPDPRT